MNQTECTHSGFCDPAVANAFLGLVVKLAEAKAPSPKTAYDMCMWLRRTAARCLEMYDAADHDGAACVPPPPAPSMQFSPMYQEDFVDYLRGQE